MVLQGIRFLAGAKEGSSYSDLLGHFLKSDPEVTWAVTYIFRKELVVEARSSLLGVSFLPDAVLFLLFFFACSLDV